MNNTQRSTDAQSPPAARLHVRQAQLEDISAIIAVVRKAYPGMLPYGRGQLTGVISRFPQGQFVVEYNGKVVGYSASFRISAELAERAHTWHDITGSGYGSRHDPEGEYLYGMEVCVDPEVRRLRIGARLYQARRRLVESANLRGIIFGGRIPSMLRRVAKFDGPAAYLDAIARGQVRDPVVSFQMRNGFEVLGLLPAYLPDDKESMGFAAHMRWRNPRYVASVAEHLPGERTTDRVRVVAVQFQQRRVRSFDEFAENISYFVDTVGSYRADFVCFPELMQLQLLSMHDSKLSASDAVDALTGYLPQLDQLFSGLAMRYNVNIIGGTYPVRQSDGRVLNEAFVYLRDGSIHRRAKIHPTPSEADWWKVEGGDSASVIHTDCGAIGVMICYDSEFPELSRYLIDQGALMLFVPFCTDERQGYMRVRHSCQARAIENQCYVVMAGSTGNLPNVHNMDIQYAQSCILTPCDFAFARDGVAADTTPNVESVAIADLSLSALRESRQSGTVRNLDNRRLDLYQLRWIGN